MSNPYAPPEDRPRTPDGDPTGTPGHHDAPPSAWPPHAQHPAPGGPVGRVGADQEPPDPEGAARATRATRLFGVLVLGSVLVVTLPLPWRASSLVFALAAIAVGAWAIVISVQARTRGITPMLAVGVLVAFTWTAFAVGQLVPWSAHQARQDCLEGALTVGAQDACQTQFEKDRDAYIGTLEDGA